jgi:hypothetical protein
MANEQPHDQLISQETIHQVVQRIAQAFSPQKIILIGSYASGHPSSDGDLDLLVVMPTNLPQHKRAVPLHLLFRPKPCAMDILVYTPQEVAYWQGTVNHIITEALSSGKVVYEG